MILISGIIKNLVFSKKNHLILLPVKNCRQISNIRPTKFQNYNGSRLVLQLSLSNPSKPDVKSRMGCVLYKRFDDMLFIMSKTVWILFGYNHTHSSGSQTKLSLHWRHNEPDGVSNHQPRDCLLNCLFRCRSKKTSKLPVTDLCAENSPGTGEFSAQKASNAENVSIWWRHHVSFNCLSSNKTLGSRYDAYKDYEENPYQ